MSNVIEYRRHHEAQIWNFDPVGRRRTRPYAGLRNQGCTCYMNSFVQQLFMLTSFRDGIMMLSTNLVGKKKRGDVISTIESESVENSTKVKGKLLSPPPSPSKESSGKLVVRQLQLLFGSLRLSNRPYAETLPLCRTLEMNGQQLRVTEQHDVNEFALQLFDQIECLGADAARLVREHFVGVSVQSIESLSKTSEYRSEREEKFYMLSVNVKGKVSSI